jgi:hypothetical protein
VGAVDEWEWRGPTAELEAMVDRLEAPDLLKRAVSLAKKRA